MAVAFSYEGLTWFTGAAVMAGGFPGSEILLLVLLYSLGAHGIMTLNDFKAVEGDRQMGIKSLPVTLGVDGAAKLACVTMAFPQMIVIALMLNWGLMWHALAIIALLIGQGFAMLRMVGDPEKYAPWYNATGVAMYVSGMLISAFGVGAL